MLLCAPTPTPLYLNLLTTHPVCPSCSNMLIITATPLHQLAPGEEHLAGQNRFECRTCPYQMVLDHRYYERRNMVSKAPEDVLGGKDSWKNVDKTEGMRTRFTLDV